MDQARSDFTDRDSTRGTMPVAMGSLHDFWWEYCTSESERIVWEDLVSSELLVLVRIVVVVGL